MLKRGGDLHQVVFTKLADCPKGHVLDVGSGGLAKKLASIGHQASACDCLPGQDWAHAGTVHYTECDLADGLPYPDASFEYIVCLEVIEHVENPMALCRELRRVLRPGGRLFISTPNILNLRSRVKFLLDGSFLFFNYPPIEWEAKEGRPSVHVCPIRYHELEYYLYKAELEVREVFSNLRSYSWRLFFPLELAIRLYAMHMKKRSYRLGKTRLNRIYSRILTDDLLFGSHLIVEATPMNLKAVLQGQRSAK